MNRIFTLVAFLLMATAGFAGWDDGRLSITSMSVNPVRVMVDGRQVQVGNREFQISNLNPGYHRVQIYAVNNNNNNNKRRGIFGNNRDELIYNTNVNIRRGMHTDIVVNRFGKVFVDEQAIDNRNDDWNNRDDRNNGGWGNDRNNDGWGNDRNNRYQPMDYQKFQQLKQSVERSNFDDNKMELLRSVLPNNAVSAQQVKELVQLMSFEQNKLELAKYAYRYTTDRNNYFIVNDAFSYGTSKTELTRYISSYRD
ncbi:DUF4476 domain-containing protein [Lacibacter luteus]|uniref:DUF4476 domain-containing protein n=1 Tax=Lacibacter luteus TaxID=2508719 RepID=A0A4Q1CDA0_9BACT|nr:DUF4476 domain-containing protein [Lacibacter luteus]RXK57515.1 DUF4476 domain-containing protein [Lacibacter luteus]